VECIECSTPALPPPPPSLHTQLHATKKCGVDHHIQLRKCKKETYFWLKMSSCTIKILAT